MGKKLWLLSGAALAAWLGIGVLANFVPSFQPRVLIAIIIVAGIWAAFSLLTLLAGARRIYKIVVSIALALAIALSVSTHWFGFPAFMLGYFGAILFLGAVLVFAALRLFRKKISVRALVLPVTMILIGACGVPLSAWASKPVPALPPQPMSITGELKYIYDTDQADRLTMYMAIDPDRDRIRLQRVKALYRAGQITEPMDQFHAAMVYQHATCADDFKVAYELAKAASGRGIPEFHPPLDHLAWDRWQLSLGKQQTYGTQLFPVPIKRPCPPAP